MHGTSDEVQVPGVAINEGRLPARKHGRDWLIKHDDLQAFVAADRKRGPKKKT